MGSGFSACSGPNSVGVTDPSRVHRVKATTQVHSDSCDSGISVCDGTRQSKKGRIHVRANLNIHDVESEEEMVAGSDVGCGPDFLMTSTPRDLNCKRSESDGEEAQTPHTADTRKNRPPSKTGTKNNLKHNPHSAPNLMDHAIHEEDEEENDGEPEDKRLRAQRPPRPKSAHFRRSRAQTRGKSARSRGHLRNGSGSGGESSADMSSEEDEFDSDVLSIPDETASHRSRPNTLTTVRLGPQFHTHGAPNNNHNDRHHGQHEDDMDWWTDEADSARHRTVSRSVSEYSASGSFTFKGGVLVRDGRVAKKASERSISSILLTTAVELDSSLSSTNHACFAVTNPDITQHILKNLQDIAQELGAAALTLLAREDASRADYCQAVTSLRPRFLRLLGDFKMATGEVLGRLPVDCKHIVQLEEVCGQQLMELTLQSRGPLDLNPLVTRHLQDLEELCEREAAPPRRPLLVQSTRRANNANHLQQPTQQVALWDESGVEDESDSMEEDLQATSAHTLVEPLSLDGVHDANNNSPASSRHDSHVTSSRGEQQSLVLSTLPPRGSLKSARPASLASSMSSSRARSSARRPNTDRSVLSGTNVHTIVESADSVSGASTTATAGGSSTGMGKSGGGKSRPDSGIVVSSCSASYSSSEATRETDADLAAQTEWIATSLEMLEQILQVRTESHETLKSLVDAITTGSTSDQLKAHALYRWLASQSLPYYAKCTSAKPNTPTGKLRQLADGKTCYAALYQEMARAAGLKCEKIDGYAKGPDYRPGTPVGGTSSSFKHSWNAVLLNGHYHFLDAGFGALPCKFFVEHFFMTPPDEMRLSHFPRDKRWLLMTQSISMHDFEGTLKTWPTMFAFNIRPLNMKSVLRSYDGRLSITVLLRNVAVTPQLEYVGPGTPQDADALAFNIDQEIRNMDNAETFHLNLPEEGTYFFTLMVHDLEEDEDIPAFQYRVEYKDELL